MGLGLESVLSEEVQAEELWCANMPLDCAQELVWEADPQLSDGALRVSKARVKRLVDIAGASLGLIVLAPFLALIAILIRLESRGPVFFRQKRTGYGGSA